jgi:hypothetical protein
MRTVIGMTLTPDSSSLAGGGGDKASGLAMSTSSRSILVTPVAVLVPMSNPFPFSYYHEKTTTISTNI